MWVMTVPQPPLERGLTSNGIEYTLHCTLKCLVLVCRWYSIHSARLHSYLRFGDQGAKCWEWHGMAAHLNVPTQSFLAAAPHRLRSDLEATFPGIKAKGA